MCLFRWILSFLLQYNYKCPMMPIIGKSSININYMISSASVIVSYAYVYKGNYVGTETIGNLRVHFRGDLKGKLVDSNPSTCQTIQRNHLRHGVQYMLLEFEYRQQAIVKVKGEKMNCGVFGAKCGEFPTTVVAQGRNRTACVGAPLCGQAYKCPVVDIRKGPNMQKCRYSCPCNGPGSENCTNVYMFFGNGSLEVGQSKMKLCDISVTV